jgi:hypothetical protein
MRKSILFLSVALFVLIVVSAEAQVTIFKKTKQNANEVSANLGTLIETADFQKPMTFKEALFLLHEKLAAKQKAVGFGVAHGAFKDEDPTAPDIFESQMKLKFQQNELTASTVLNRMLAEIPTKNAAFVVRDGYVEITTVARAKKEKKTT